MVQEIHLNGQNGQNGHKTYLEAGAQLRQLLARDQILTAPGVYDGITARAAIKTGFEALYMSGAAVTASRLGLPDLAFASMDDFVEVASVIANIPGCPPLICDADVGFGSSAQIARMVQRYHRAGVAGFHLEDQVQTKRCGHLLGKQIVEEEEFVRRIRAAAIGRERVPGGSSIVIIARTDALQGQSFDAAISRLRNAIAAGADVAFLEGVENEEQVKQAALLLAPTPLLVNLVVGGSTPVWSAKDCEKFGAKVAILPGAALAPVAEAALRAYEHVREHGRDIGSSPDYQAGTVTSPKELFRLVGLEDALAIDMAAGGQAYTSVL